MAQEKAALLSLSSGELELRKNVGFVKKCVQLTAKVFIIINDIILNLE